MKKNQHIVQDERAFKAERQAVPPRVPARLEGVVKNAGIRKKKKDPKPRPK